MTKRAQIGIEEMRRVKDANRAADAYNAGYRRGSRGLPREGRYVAHPEFEKGYKEGSNDANC